MKKKLLALAAIAGISMLFMGCPHSTKTPASDPVIDNSGDDTPVEESKEKVFVENADGLDNCSVLVKYDELKAVADEHADAAFVIVVKNTSGAGRTGWGCGQIYTSLDPDDAYNTKDEVILDDYKPTGLANDGDTEELSFVLMSDVLAKVAEGGCVSFNLWNGIVAVKAYAKW